MLSVIGARVIRHGRTGDRSHTGLIRHVTSDTRSLITRAQLTPSDFRLQTQEICNVCMDSQEGIKLVQRISRQREFVMRSISSPLPDIF